MFEIKVYISIDSKEHTASFLFREHLHNSSGNAILNELQGTSLSRQNREAREIFKTPDSAFAPERLLNPDRDDRSFNHKMKVKNDYKVDRVID